MREGWWQGGADWTSRGPGGGKGEGDIEGVVRLRNSSLGGDKLSSISWAISIPRVSCAAQLLLWEASFNVSLGGHTQARCDKINSQARGIQRHFAAADDLGMSALDATAQFLSEIAPYQ